MEVVPVATGSVRFDQVVALAGEVLAQDRYLKASLPHAEATVLLGAFRGDDCVGFLRYLVQWIGADCGRPPILRNGQRLREGYVEAFGVAPSARRQGIGEALQLHAMDQCRSRSPVTSVENYALKLKMGYVVHPSEQNDSYYFVLRL
jgi:GNAT superfamily N-acetyltransferase